MIPRYEIYNVKVTRWSYYYTIRTKLGELSCFEHETKNWHKTGVLRYKCIAFEYDEYSDGEVYIKVTSKEFAKIFEL